MRWSVCQVGWYDDELGRDVGRSHKQCQRSPAPSREPGDFQESSSSGKGHQVTLDRAGDTSQRRRSSRNVARYAGAGVTQVGACGSQGLASRRIWQVFLMQQTETIRLRTGQSLLRGELTVPGWI